MFEAGKFVKERCIMIMIKPCSLRSWCILFFALKCSEGVNSTLTTPSTTLSSLRLREVTQIMRLMLQCISIYCYHPHLEVLSIHCLLLKLAIQVAMTHLVQTCSTTAFSALIAATAEFECSLLTVNIFYPIEQEVASTWYGGSIELARLCRSCAHPNLGLRRRAWLVKRQLSICSGTRWNLPQRKPSPKCFCGPEALHCYQKKHMSTSTAKCVRSKLDSINFRHLILPNVPSSKLPLSFYSNLTVFLQDSRT